MSKLTPRMLVGGVAAVVGSVATAAGAHAMADAGDQVYLGAYASPERCWRDVHSNSQLGLPGRFSCTKHESGAWIQLYTEPAV